MFVRVAQHYTDMLLNPTLMMLFISFWKIVRSDSDSVCVYPLFHLLRHQLWSFANVSHLQILPTLTAIACIHQVPTSGPVLADRRPPLQTMRTPSTHW